MRNKRGIIMKHFESTRDQSIPTKTHRRRGDLDDPKPYKYIGFGHIDGFKPLTFLGFGDLDGAKPYTFIFTVGQWHIFIL